MSFRGGGARKNTLFIGFLNLQFFRFNRKKYSGFTLSEVLITLGIIGIVAAMTLPSLIGSYKEKQWKVAYKKAYSSFSQAFLRMQEDGDFVAITPQLVSGGNYYTPAIGENFKITIKYGAAAGIFRFGVVAAEVAVDIADLRNVDNGAAGRSRHAGFNAVVYGSVAVKAAVDAADDRVGRV